MRDATPSGPPGPDEVKVVVYRGGSIMGYAVTLPVYDGETLLGFAERNSYFEYRCSPGKRIFMSWAENEKVIEATLAGGKTYYMNAYPKMGGFSAAAGFIPITKAHESWAGIEEIVAGLTCRAVIPEKAAEHEDRRREKARKIMKEHAAGEEDSLYLKLEDGK